MAPTPFLRVHLQPEGLFSTKVFFFNFYCYSITVVCIFSPSLHPTPAKPTSLPHLHTPLDFVHLSFIVVPVIPSPHCPLPTPLWLLLHSSEVPRYLKYTKVFKLYERSGGRTGIFWFLVSSFHVACANQLQFTKREGMEDELRRKDSGNEKCQEKLET